MIQRVTCPAPARQCMRGSRCSEGGRLDPAGRAVSEHERRARTLRCMDVGPRESVWGVDLDDGHPTDAATKTTPTSPSASRPIRPASSRVSTSGRAVGAALNPETEDAKAAGIAIRLIEQADPPSQATVEVSGPVSVEDIKGWSFSQLIAYADAHGIDYTRPPDDPSQTSPTALP
jgi:hypothetical protein